MFALFCIRRFNQPAYPSADNALGKNVILDIDYCAAEACNADKSKENMLTNATETISLNPPTRRKKISTATHFRIGRFLCIFFPMKETTRDEQSLYII